MYGAAQNEYKAAFIRKLVNLESSSLELLDFTCGEFHIELHVRNESDDFTWNLVVVYGAAQNEYKAAFLRKLVNLAKHNSYPILIGGDFNSLRFQQDNNNGLITIGPSC